MKLLLSGRLKELTNTPHIFSHSVLSKYLIEEMSLMTNNIFDLVINHKINEIVLNSSQESLSFSRVNKYLKSIKKYNLLNQDTLINVNILEAYGLTNKYIGDINNRYNCLAEVYSSYEKDDFELGWNSNRRVSQAFASFLGDITTNEDYIKEIILFLLLVNKRVNKNEFITIIFNHIKKYYPFLIVEDDIIEKNIEQLKKDDYLLLKDEDIIFPPNIYYGIDLGPNYHKSFRYYLDFDFVYQDILKMRLQGFTLSKIGKETNQSRERIRQVQNNMSFIFNDTREFIAYRDIYEKYRLDKAIFNNLFLEKDETYYLMKFMCKKGTEKLTYDCLLSDPLFKDEYFSSMNLDYLKDREVKEAKNIEDIEAKHTKTKKEAVQEFLEEHNEITFKVHDFFTLYNNSHEDELKLTSERSILTIISKLRNVISGARQTFRFFDFTNKENMAFYVFDAMSSYKDGEYSAYKIFADNPLLMENLEVRDGYELHNFIKGNEDKFYGFKLGKSPMILKGFNSKKEFINYELSICSGMNVEDFLRKLYKEYGLNKSSYRVYLDVGFKDFVYDGKILDLSRSYDDKFIDSIKDKVTDDIYKLSEFCELAKVDENEITTELLHDISYYRRGEFLFSGNFDSLTSAVRHMIFKNSLKLNEINEDPVIKRIISNLETSKKVFELGNNKFCTIDNLKQKGFSEIDVDNFIDKVIDVSKNKKYFSIESIYDELSGDKLFDYAFMEGFYDAIIGFSGKFTILRRNFNNDLRLFTNEEGSFRDFVYIELNSLGGSAYMNEFIDHISDKYAMTITEKIVRKNVEKYASSLDKIYNDKVDYYKEIG